MNKQKKLKLILTSLKEKQLLKFFQVFLETIKCKFYKSVKQISFSCYQSTCQVQKYMVNGYGKTSSQALISGINNIIDCLIQEDPYCEAIRQCLKKINLSAGNLTDNGTTSKKQLLSTQKAIKTLGPETSMPLEKKVLTMSANLSSNSKNSSSKPKSIKQEIFEYFNLDNLKVKKPSQVFSSVTPMSVNNKIYKNIQKVEVFNLFKSKEKFRQGEDERNSGTFLADKKLEQIYKRIKEVKQLITHSEKQNLQLKQEIQVKKKTGHKPQENLINQYFTRPSLECKQQKKVNPSLNTQSNKKLSYFQMSLIDKIANQQIKQSIRPGKLEISNQNYFEKVQISQNFKPSKTTTQNLNQKKNKITEHTNANTSGQRKCLVDISNFKNQVSELKINLKPAQYATFNGQIITKASDSKQSVSAFQTAVNCQNNDQQNTSQIMHSKMSQKQQQSMQIIESSKKLRSFSVQNSLNEKLKSYGTSQKNPLSILSSVNLNASFDNGSLIDAKRSIPQKKIKIPKLNLQILPNYHGRSNKSLNQSLMQNYQKKSQAPTNQ